MTCTKRSAPGSGASSRAPTCHRLPDGKKRSQRMNWNLLGFGDRPRILKFKNSGSVPETKQIPIHSHLCLGFPVAQQACDGVVALGGGEGQRGLAAFVFPFRVG